MKTEHPIAPPPELVTQWLVEWENKGSTEPPFSGSHEYVSALAARWGADQELEACCQEVHDWYGNGSRLRAARRPKPPSLKEQALQALALLKVDASTHGLGFDSSAIRRALEALPDV